MSESFIEITSGTGTKIAAHSITEDGFTKYLERTALGTGTLSISGTAEIDGESTAGLYPASGSTAINTIGLNRIVIRTSFDQPSATASFKIQLYDVEDILIGVLPSPSDTYIAISSSSEKDTYDKYIGTMFIISNDCGASGIRIRLTATVSSGEVIFRVRGI